MTSRTARENHGGLLVLGLLSLIVGAVSGSLGVLFRSSLGQADRFRTLFLAWAQGGSVIGLLMVVLATAGSTAFAVWLVRRFAPQASGSGIPHVEAVLHGEQPPAHFVLIPVKFVGGVLAIGCGLALGREGPTVQMGASIAHAIGTLFRRDPDDCRVLLAAGAGAGLAAAFNSPIAGAVFVLEELVRRFETRTAISALGASAGAIAVARLFYRDSPDFRLIAPPFPAFGTMPMYLALGVFVGVLGVAYSRAILGALAVADRLSRWPAEARALLVGAAVGVLAWISPDMVGGGDAITQRALEGTGSLGAIALIFIVRFALGAVSYAAGTPGGLFAPMLVLGAQAGLGFGKLCVGWLPGVAVDSTAFAVVALAAFFTAVVRAPITGIILATEMTGSFTLLLPMLTSCFAAMIVPAMLRSPPIYDSLRDRMPQAKRDPAR
ncbi:H(+)/Cl(-) exchange transporter ClcA [Paraburkholderia kirstenboschensis]|uniref:H(+)/Cl(-) exchange transporter ClcA n=1 Tax=Paraburkholderia kirstenboschensis TaxID=1245436 RepID=A0ABZ0EFE2_9BURK|nr:H(+)/Cl(-) exchange transporter ClcA [Paraburkholderia kirstenboschensis]WOD15933.1 H(+)/Cl(-) exchange transporter ClcA [Paraburkholderia kirstenboschensis]